MKLLSEIDTNLKRVFLRADLDVTVENGRVTDDFRLQKILPTLQSLLKRGHRLILAGHRGRPRGKADPNLSLKPVAKWLEEQGLTVEFLGNLNFLYSFKSLEQIQNSPSQQPLQGDPLQTFTQQGPDSKIILLENLRFDIREEENDPIFAQELASLANIYVNEAFATSFEEHASIVSLPKLLPSYAGLQLSKEVSFLLQVLKNPQRPLIFIMAGVKPEKVKLIPAFAKIADSLLLAGKMWQGLDLKNLANVLIPLDSTDDLDIGPKTIARYLQEISKAKTVVWNGPVGKFEQEKYSIGTRALAEYLASSKNQSLVVIGGGDTIAALDQLNLLKKIEESQNMFISTGGGAMLEFLAQGSLVGIEALG